MAEEKAIEANLGDWVAELEVPGTVVKSFGAAKQRGRHVSLLDTSPDQVRGYIVAMTRVTRTTPSG